VILADSYLIGVVVLDGSAILQSHYEDDVVVRAIIHQEQGLAVTVWGGQPKHLLYLVDGGHCVDKFTVAPGTIPSFAAASLM